MLASKNLAHLHQVSFVKQGWSAKNASPRRTSNNFKLTPVEAHHKSYIAQ